MPEPVVVADRLSKRYRLYSTPWDRLLEAATRRPRHRELAALDDVSFRLARGEGLAVVGENGAGKSTLLKILAGITAPSAGSLSVRGTVASILELGSGFHPEFTGRQNVVLNAAMLGLTESDVRRRMPDILDFSELGDFIDQPVKCYSTGMAMRLGFSIATQVDPEVLIIDEALSVGDGYFQKKCMDRLQRYVESGGTLLFCSHAMYYVSAFCRRALWLRRGRAEALGSVEDVVRDYENYLVARSAARTAATGRGSDEAAADGAVAGPGEAVPLPPARITSVRMAGSEVSPNRPAGPFRRGDEVTVEVAWKCDDPDLAFHVGIGVNRLDDLEVCAFSTLHDGWTPVTGDTYHRLALVLPELPLVKGQFSLYVYVLDDHGLHVYDQRVIRPAFSVESPGYRFGLIEAAHTWRVPAERALEERVEERVGIELGIESR